MGKAIVTLIGEGEVAEARQWESKDELFIAYCPERVLPGNVKRASI